MQAILSGKTPSRMKYSFFFKWRCLKLRIAFCHSPSGISAKELSAARTVASHSGLMGVTVKSQNVILHQERLKVHRILRQACSALINGPLKDSATEVRFSEGLP